MPNVILEIQFGPTEDENYEKKKQVSLVEEAFKDYYRFDRHIYDRYAGV